MWQSDKLNETQHANSEDLIDVGSKRICFCHDQADRIFTSNSMESIRFCLDLKPDVISHLFVMHWTPVLKMKKKHFKFYSLLVQVLMDGL